MRNEMTAIMGTREERERYAVVQVQSRLRTLQDPSLSITGVMDQRTVSELTKFQKRMGLFPNGSANLETWNALWEEVQILSSLSYPTALTLPPITLFHERLDVGDTGEWVFLLQILLNRFLLTRENQSPLAIDGVYGEETANAVRLFRSQYRLPNEQWVDGITLRRLSQAFSSPPSYE